MSKKVTEKLVKPVKNNTENTEIDLLGGIEEEVVQDQKARSIFFEMPNKATPVVLTGVALRMVDYKTKSEPARTLDIRFKIDETTTKVASIPEFSKIVWADAILLLRKYKVQITKMHQTHERVNLKTYDWVQVPNVVAMLTPNEFKDRIWIGRIEEINLDATGVLPEVA